MFSKMLPMLSRWYSESKSKIRKRRFGTLSLQFKIHEFKFAAQITDCLECRFPVWPDLVVLRPAWSFFYVSVGRKSDWSEPTRHPSLVVFDREYGVREVLGVTLLLLLLLLFSSIMNTLWNICQKWNYSVWNGIIRYRTVLQQSCSSIDSRSWTRCNFGLVVGTNNLD